jgi:hypothetical protein
MSLSSKHTKDVCCELGRSNQCRYLDEDFDDAENIISVCKKLTPDKKIIDIEVVDFLNNCKKNGQDPYLMNVALGDNCKGYLNLKTKKQGYDIKN